MDRPLAGIRVLEIANFVAVPSTAALMADMGADVIKVEPPEGDPWRYLPRSRQFGYDFAISYGFQLDNRGKRSVALDLKKQGAIEVVKKLARAMDVFMTNLLPHRLERYRLRYKDLKPLNPGLVYLAFSGLGSTGPDRERPALDETALWTRSGILSTLGEPGQTPMDVGSSMGDHATSGLLLSGVLAALLARTRSGKGQRVTGSLFNSGIWIAGLDLQETLVARRNPARYKRAERHPLHNFYRTRDSRWINLVMIHTDANWSRLCRAIGREDLLSNPRYSTVASRTERSPELISDLDKVFNSRTLDELAPCLDINRVIWEPVRGLLEVVDDPQARANGFFTTLVHPNYGPYETLNTPVQFSDSQVGPRAAAPEVGQHTEEMLLELGYTWDDINGLRGAGVIT